MHLVIGSNHCLNSTGILEVAGHEQIGLEIGAQYYAWALRAAR